MEATEEIIYQVKYMKDGKSFDAHAKQRYRNIDAIYVIISGDHKDDLLNSWDILSRTPLQNMVEQVKELMSA